MLCGSSDSSGRGAKGLEPGVIKSWRAGSRLMSWISFFHKNQFLQTWLCAVPAFYWRLCDVQPSAVHLVGGSWSLGDVPPRVGDPPGSWLPALGELRSGSGSAATLHVGGVYFLERKLDLYCTPFKSNLSVATIYRNIFLLQHLPIAGIYGFISQL